MPAGRSCSPLTGSASSGCSQRCAPPHAMGVVALGGLSTAVVLHDDSLHCHAKHFVLDSAFAFHCCWLLAVMASATASF